MYIYIYIYVYIYIYINMWVHYGMDALSDEFNKTGLKLCYIIESSRCGAFSCDYKEYHISQLYMYHNH